MGRPQAGGKAAVGGAQPRQNRPEDDLPAAGTGLLQGAAGAGPAAEDRRSGRQSALAPPAGRGGLRPISRSLHKFKAVYLPRVKDLRARRINSSTASESSMGAITAAASVCP